MALSTAKRVPTPHGSQHRLTVTVFKKVTKVTVKFQLWLKMVSMIVDSR
jgi:glyceraldehyde-3-phosphate dehydrogenase/erythrose-4-phosphate dehydrogenase